MCILSSFIVAFTYVRFQFTMELLRQTESSDLLLAIVDNIKRGLSLWACMDTIPLVMSGLVHAHQSWKSRGLYIRCLINLILEIDNRRYLDLLSRQQIIEDVRNFARVSFYFQRKYDSLLSSDFTRNQVLMTIKLVNSHSISTKCIHYHKLQMSMLPQLLRTRSGISIGLFRNGLTECGKM